MDFWSWSNAAYGRGEVAKTLIALQDSFGLDVNVALWCVWAGASGRGQFPEYALRKAVALSESWGAGVTAPLRAARRAARTPPARADAAAAEALREQIKSVELQSEKILQSMLERLLDPAPAAAEADGEAAARKNLAQYAALSGAARRPGFSISALLRVVEDIFAEDGNAKSSA